MKALITLALATAGTVLADGGVIVAQQQAGPWHVILFASPSPLRVGPVEFSLLVQNPGTMQPVLDLDVTLRISRPGSRVGVVRATRSQAKNQWFYSATFVVPSTGTWRITGVMKSANAEGRLATTVMVSEAWEPIYTYAPWFAAVPFCIAFFAVSQRLKRRSHIGP